MTLGTKTARTLIVVLIAACVAVVAASIVVIRQSNRIDTIERRIGAGSVDQVASGADRDARNAHFSLVSPEKTTRVDGVITPRGDAFIIGGNLAEAQPDHAYQLWAQSPAGMISIGWLGKDAVKPFAFRLPRGATTLLVADAPIAGSTTPGETLVSGTIPSLP